METLTISPIWVALVNLVVYEAVDYLTVSRKQIMRKYSIDTTSDAASHMKRDSSIAAHDSNDGICKHWNLLPTIQTPCLITIHLNRGPRTVRHSAPRSSVKSNEAGGISSSSASAPHQSLVSRLCALLLKVASVEDFSFFSPAARASTTGPTVVFV